MKNPTIRWFGVSLILALGAGLAAWFGAGQEAPWYGVMPPLIAVGLALATGRVVLSLGTAVFIGGVLAAVPQAPLTIAAWGTGLVTGPGYLWNSISDKTNLQILAFVVFVMAAIAVMHVAGGLQGMVNWVSRFARGYRSTQLVTGVVGVLLFIDDYANTMLVGNSMRPLTDRARISREKLAFLVDATSAPVAGVAVLSTWIGYEVGLFGKTAASLGIPKDGYAMFFDALSFRFYCLLMIFFVMLNALTGRDFGPMAQAQRRAREEGNERDREGPAARFTLSSLQPHAAARVRGLSAAIPIAALFLFLLAGLWWDGKGPEHVGRSGLFSVLSFSVWRDVLSTSENSILLLAYASALGLAVAALCAGALARLSVGAIGRAALGGVRASLLPMLILVLAWSLKGACDGLATGKFLAGTVGQVISPTLFPAILFATAGLTAFATGTSWGTMAILIPTAVPIAFQLDGNTYGLVTMISLGAVLDGAIFGDHCSPISDTTIMSSTSSACDHLAHVRTQLPYSLLVASVAVGAGYLPAALGVPSWLGLLVGAAVLSGFFWVLSGGWRAGFGWKGYGLGTEVEAR